MGHLQPVPMNRGATVARDAILCVKLWKSLVCRDTGQKHYFPSYLIELIAIKCQLEEPHQLVTVGVMFAHVLTRIANHEQISCTRGIASTKIRTLAWGCRIVARRLEQILGTQPTTWQGLQHLESSLTQPTTLQGPQQGESSLTGRFGRGKQSKC